MKERTKGLISVIVPVYNNEKFLDKCVTSILKQTYKKIEVILVNDGSTDGSLAICRYYEQLDERVKVIDKKNAGVSAARNSGINIATGEFVGFIDSDDYIEPNMYKELMEYMQAENCDLVECAVNLDDGIKLQIFNGGNNYCLSGREALKAQLDAPTFNCLPRVAVWNKLYHYQFWNENKFPEGKVHEEFMVTTIALYEAKKVGIVNHGLYNHLITNPDSITHAKFSEKNFHLEVQYNNRVRYLEKNHEKELCNLAKKNYYVLILALFYNCYKNKMSQEVYYQKIIKDNLREILKFNLGIKYKVKFCLIAYLPKVFCYMTDKRARMN